MLESMVPVYRAYLEPGARNQISALLTRLRAIYFVPEMSGALAKALADDWADDLGKYPLWAVKTACDSYRRTESMKIPKPAAIIALARDEILEQQWELHQMTLALAAPPAELEHTRATPEQVEAIFEKSGFHEDLAETEAKRNAEKPRSESSKRMQERANIATMKTLNRQRAEASGG